jgi:hypothetical protein
VREREGIMPRFRVVLVAMAVLGLVAAVAPPSHATTSGLFYTGDAYGSYANVGKTIIAGKTAVVGFGCQTLAGRHVANTIASVNASPVITTGAINTTGDSTDTGTAQASQFTADVHDVNLLAGLITATEVKAVSTTSNDATGLHVSAAGSTFVNLVVGGNAITVMPAPNTVLTLSVGGQVVGTVTLNEQIQSIGATKAALTVNMIHVKLTADIPGVATAGTNIIVSHAKSDLELNKAGSLDGQAYGTKATVGSLILSGPTAVVHMPCGGTNGKVVTNSVATVDLGTLGSSGTVTDTAQGTITGTLASGETTSTVQALKLLSSDGGQTFLITADLVKADAHASKSGGVLSFSDSGSTFVNLVVNGTPIADNVAANTQITVDGLTIWLHRVIQKPNQITVRMIEIIVNGANPFGLNLSTDIQVAVAEASAH